MRVIIGGVYYPTLDGSSVSISRSVSDPVPTCTVNLIDITSSISIPSPAEILVLDDQVIPNPTINLLLNPSLNPHTTGWLEGATGAVGLTQIGGGGLQMAFTSAASGANGHTAQFGIMVQPGQASMLSVFLQGTATPANIEAILTVQWTDAAGNLTGTINTTISSIPTAVTRFSLSGVAPATTTFAVVTITCQSTANGVTGTIAITKPQFEPQWFPTLTYPLPWCGPAQTNCQQLPLGYWIRQYRKFAGFVNHTNPNSYHGNVRTYTVNAVGYAWLASTIIVNDSFSSQTDAQIITSLTNTYLTSNGTALCNLSTVIAGATFTSVQSNWDDLRTIFDNLASQSTFYWTIDYYWNFIYAPPSYFSMPISLICDTSGTPDMVTTFPAYTFSSEDDYTQPGSSILVIGNGTNVAKVIDPSTTAQNGFTSGYFLPVGSSWMRKVNESSLASVADCTTRGMAELIQYDYARSLLHLTTNVELIAGEGIRVTSATDGLNQTALLIQQVTATWIGTSETLTDQWEYQADLGATNRAATNILSRLFRIANSNTSAPAISTTTLAVIETIGVVDTTAIGTTVSNYAQTVLADTPVAYYRLAEITGTITDDISGNANQGTTHNSPTQGVATLLADPADSTDSAMTFATASSQYISLPTSFIPTGSGHAWSLECWCKVSSTAASQFYALVGMGDSGTVREEGQLYVQTNGSNVATFLLSCNSADISGGTITIGNIYHVVGTYDGTSTRLYVNGSLVAGPTAFALNLVATFAAIGANISAGNPIRFFNGTIDEPAFYTYALSAAQVSAHFTAGT